jgi:hypothetical protein
MTNDRSFISAETFDGDLYTSSQTRERTLNSALDEPGRCFDCRPNGIGCGIR